MSRKKRIKDTSSATKVRVRNRERRTRRNDDKRPDDLSWLTRITARMAAARILNNDPQRPYIVSIPDRDGIEPVSGFYPCSISKQGGRIFYHFLIRDHRDAFYGQHDGARKELTPD